jgi:diacylglycerol kinase family enzyme
MRDGYPEVDETSSITVASHAPLFIIINGGSGQGDPTGTRATIEDVLAQGDRPYRIIVVEDAARLGRIASEVVEHARAEGGVIVAAGGDGTINAVARAVLGSGCAFGVIPQGTFNYFAREHGIPLDTAEATRALLDARPRPRPCKNSPVRRESDASRHRSGKPMNSNATNQFS